MSKTRHITPQVFKMLIYSNTLIVPTLGISLLLALVRVIRIACKSATHPCPQDLLILGKSLVNGQADQDYLLRLHRAKILYEQGYASHLVILGGRSSPAEPTEASIGKSILEQEGIPGVIISLEEASQHTLENLRYARELLGHRASGQLGLLTSRYHLARSHAMAGRLGLNVVPIAAEKCCTSAPAGRYISEAYMLHWYLVGEFIARHFNDQASLDQIS
jgi:uncharacterized SAM-binding protein YcdF (DUF218 family)